MGLKGFRVVALVVGLCALAGVGWAWDATGHMQIADVAWTRLNPKAKAQIAQILMAGDPGFRPASGDEAAVRAAFRKAATFPDVIKGSHSTIYEDIIEPMNGTFFKHGLPPASDSEGNRCKTWHYYDTPIPKGKGEPPRQSNAINALALARKELARLEATPQPDRKMQAWWLYWIEHVVGDLHQPLHCVSNFEVQPKGGDQGGNLFMIDNPELPGRPSRLHGYWDFGISRTINADEKKGLAKDPESVSERLLRDAFLQPQTRDALDLDAKHWVAAGARLAEWDVYYGLAQNGTPSDGYVENQDLLCRRQALLAGYRLAEILNRTLGK